MRSFRVAAISTIFLSAVFFLLSSSASAQVALSVEIFQLGMGKDRTDGVMPELFDIVVVGDIECESPRCSGLEDYTAHGRIFVGQKLCILIAPRRIDLEAETPAQALILSECERMSAVIAHRDPQVNRLILKVVQL